MKENSFKRAKKRWYSAKTITDADYADDKALLEVTSAQAKTQLYSQERAAVDLHINADNTAYMCFNLRGDISTLGGGETNWRVHPLESCVSSKEKDINTRLAKTWTATDRLSVIWNSDLTDKIKLNFSEQRSC